MELDFKYAILAQTSVTIATDTFLGDLINMHKIFDAINPPKSVVSKYGLPLGFAKIFHQKYPNYSLDTLSIISKLFLVIRVRLMNSHEASKTLRANKKKAEYASVNA